MAHACDAIVISCIDFRFQRFVRDWLNTHMTDKTFDYLGYAGSTKDLEIVMKQVDISKRLHEIKEAVLIHHEDCGAYGNESTPERHSEDLHRSKQAIIEKYPDITVSLYYLHLDGTFEEVA